MTIDQPPVLTNWPSHSPEPEAEVEQQESCIYPLSGSPFNMEPQQAEQVREHDWFIHEK